MVVDAVVWYWVEEILKSPYVQGGRGRKGRHQKPLFYKNDVMIALSDLVWLKGVFSTLVGLFDWVSLRRKVGKMFRMVYHPCCATGTQSEAAHEQWMTGAGSSYRERHQVQVQC